MTPSYQTTSSVLRTFEVLLDLELKRQRSLMEEVARLAQERRMSGLGETSRWVADTMITPRLRELGSISRRITLLRDRISELKSSRQTTTILSFNE